MLRSSIHKMIIEMSSNLDLALQKYKFPIVNAPQVKAYSGHEINLLFMFSVLKLTSKQCLERIMDQFEKELPIDFEDFKTCKLIPHFGEDFKVELIHLENKFYVVMKHKNRFINICQRDRNNIPFVSGKALYSED